MKYTTNVNPGAFKARRLRSVRSFAGILLHMLKKRELAQAINFTLTESVNMVNERLRRNSTPRFLCNICNNSSPYFIHLSNRIRRSWNSSCPNCDSRARHRGLFFLYSDAIENIPDDFKILHIAPEPIFFNLFKNKDNFIYHTSDYLLEDVDFPSEDIQHLSFADNSYDLILCNHVIEHVPSDDDAFREINRVLKIGGKAIITIPGNFNSKETVYFETLEFNGHYRD